MPNSIQWSQFDGLISDDINDCVIAEVYAKDKIEKAKFIVRACNAHEELLEALKEAKRIIFNVTDGECDGFMSRMDSAIAKAEGK